MIYANVYMIMIVQQVYDTTTTIQHAWAVGVDLDLISAQDSPRTHSIQFKAKVTEDE